MWGDLVLCQISSPTTIVERAGAYAWGHKNWRVREEFARTAASALNLFTAAELPFQRLILPSVWSLDQEVLRIVFFISYSWGLMILLQEDATLMKLSCVAVLFHDHHLHCH